MSRIEKIILGSQLPIERQFYKYAFLRAYFCIIIFIVALFYLVLDTVHRVDEFIPWYYVMMFVSVLGIYINRLGKYLLASVLLITFSNIIVFVFANSDDPFSGLYFYFIAISLTSLVIFGYKGRIVGFACVLVSLGLGILAFVYDFNIIKPTLNNELNIKISFLTNFIVGLLSCSFQQTLAG